MLSGHQNWEIIPAVISPFRTRDLKAQTQAITYINVLQHITKYRNNNCLSLEEGQFSELTVRTTFNERPQNSQNEAGSNKTLDKFSITLTFVPNFNATGLNENCEISDKLVNKIMSYFPKKMRKYANIRSSKLFNSTRQIGTYDIHLSLELDNIIKPEYQVDDLTQRAIAITAHVFTIINQIEPLPNFIQANIQEMVEFTPIPISDIIRDRATLEPKYALEMAKDLNLNTNEIVFIGKQFNKNPDIKIDFIWTEGPDFSKETIELSSDEEEGIEKITNSNNNSKVISSDSDEEQDSDVEQSSTEATSDSDSDEEIKPHQIVLPEKDNLSENEEEELPFPVVESGDNETEDNIPFYLFNENKKNNNTALKFFRLAKERILGAAKLQEELKELLLSNNNNEIKMEELRKKIPHLTLPFEEILILAGIFARFDLPSEARDLYECIAEPTLALNYINTIYYVKAQMSIIYILQGQINSQSSPDEIETINLTIMQTWEHVFGIAERRIEILERGKEKNKPNENELNELNEIKSRIESHILALLTNEVSSNKEFTLEGGLMNICKKIFMKQSKLVEENKQLKKELAALKEQVKNQNGSKKEIHLPHLSFLHGNNKRSADKTDSQKNRSQKRKLHR